MTLSAYEFGSSALFKRSAAFTWIPRANWVGLASTTSVLLVAFFLAGLIGPEGRHSSGATNPALSLRNLSGIMARLSSNDGEMRKSTPLLCRGCSKVSSYSSCPDLSNDSDGVAQDDPTSCKYEPHHQATKYDWSQATDVNHQRVECESSDTYQSPFREIRLGLDRQFHSEYSQDRERFQDEVIQSLLKRDQSSAGAAEGDPVVDHGPANQNPQRKNPHSISKAPHWIVFSAGAMGAGKTWTVKLLHEKGRFPLHEFVTVDPDAIRHQLPEYQTYVKFCPDRAGELTRKESGMIAEILVKVALEQGRNVLVDGSLRNSSWYLNYFKWLRNEYENIRIAIFHVTAPRHTILSRAARRSNETGRVVPVDLLERVIAEVPLSFRRLRPHVDFAVELRNAHDDADDVELIDPTMSWLQFTQLWESA